MVLGFVLGKISAILGELGALDFKNGEIYGQKHWGVLKASWSPSWGQVGAKIGVKRFWRGVALEDAS